MNNMYDILARMNLLEGKGTKPDFPDIDRDGDRTEPISNAAKEMDEASYSAKAARAGKDIGKPGKQFAKIAKSAGERYGSKERGEKVAGAVLAKLRAKESVEENTEIEEKWGAPTRVSPEEKGKYAGKSKDELLKQYNALKKSGPHKKGSADYGKMRELAFAIRAKSDWGKVQEDEMEEGNEFTQARMDAIRAGKPSFSVGGKTYRVSGDTSDERRQMKMDESVIEEGYADFFDKKQMYKKIGADVEGRSDDYVVTFKDGTRKRYQEVDGRRRVTSLEPVDRNDAVDDSGEVVKRGRGRPKGTGRKLGTRGVTDVRKKRVKESEPGADQEGPADLLAAVEEEINNPGRTVDNLRDVMNATFGSDRSPEFKKARAVIGKYIDLVDTAAMGSEEDGIAPMTHGNIARHIKEYDLTDRLAHAAAMLDKVVGSRGPVTENDQEGPADLLAAVEEEINNPGRTVDNLRDVMNATFGSDRSPEFKKARAVIGKYLDLVDNAAMGSEQDGIAPMTHGNIARHIREYDLTDYLQHAAAKLDAIVGNAIKEDYDKDEYDEEGEMAKSQARTIADAAQELQSILDDDENLPEWVQKKITLALEYIDTARDYLKANRPETEDGEEEIMAEKAVSKAQRAAAGIARAAQKGEIPKSELRGASKEMAKMPAGELKKFAKTKEKGLPEKVKETDKEEVEETTTAGSVATAPAAGKTKGIFGKGVYEGAIAESFEQKLGVVLKEGMNVSTNQSEDNKSLTITATDEDADQLADMLKMAGLFSSGGYQKACPMCGKMHGVDECAEQVEEDYANSAEDTETMDTDYMVNDIAGGLNGPKLQVNPNNMADNPLAMRNLGSRGASGQVNLGRMAEGVKAEAENRLWELYQRYDAK